MKDIIKIESYQKNLVKFNRNKRIELCKGISLDWYNHLASTKYISSKLKTDLFAQEYDQLKEEIEQLKTQFIWLRWRKNIIRRTYFQLFCDYLTRPDCLQQDQAILEISYLSSQGPYQQCSLADITNSPHFQSFIAWQVLHEEVPRRELRVYLSSTVILQWGGADYHSSPMKVLGLSLDGLHLFGFLPTDRDWSNNADQDIKLYWDINQLEKFSMLSLDGNLTRAQHSLIYPLTKVKPIVISKIVQIPKNVTDNNHHYFINKSQLDSQGQRVINQFLSVLNQNLIKEPA